MRRLARPAVARLLLGLSIAALGLALLEVLARLGEGRLRPAEAPAARDPLNPVLAVGTSGELRPSFFVDAADHLTIRAVYTTGDHCYPFHCQSIPKAKPAAEFRIGCFGGSTTYGLGLRQRTPAPAADVGWVPYPDDSPFCELLREGLQTTMPGRNVTAYNLGGVAADSAGVLSIMRETSHLLPFDLWVVYMGHNEFLYASDLVEPRDRLAPAASFARLIARHSAVFRLMLRAHARLRPPPAQGRLRRYQPRAYVRTPSHREVVSRVLAAYEARLREALGLANEAGATVVLSELVANHEWSPPEGEERLECYSAEATSVVVEQIRANYRAARALERAGRFEQALAIYRQVDALDDCYHPALLGSAHCLLALGRRQAALRHSVQARRCAAVPAVATPDVIEALRRVSRETGTPLAAQVEPFDQIFLSDPERYARLFSDDCHPTGEGHRLIAQQIIAALQATPHRPRDLPDALHRP